MYTTLVFGVYRYVFQIASGQAWRAFRTIVDGVQPDLHVVFASPDQQIMAPVEVHIGPDHFIAPQTVH